LSKPILKGGAPFLKNVLTFASVVFAAVLSLARGYFDEAISLFLSLHRVHQELLLLDGFADERWK
jgi:hypothetical protein